VTKKPRSPLPTLDRLFEGLLGVVLAVASLVPLLMALGAPFVFSNANEWRWAVFGSVGGAVVFAWCARTAWRLMTGRARSDGGLLSPWLIAAGGVGAAAGVVFGLSEFGLRWIFGALYVGSISVGCFELARRRFAQRGSNKDHAA
jgi:hypothetical protein